MVNLTNNNFEQDPIATNTYYNYKNPAVGETGNVTFYWANDQSVSPTHSLKIVSTYLSGQSWSRWLSNNTSLPAVAGAVYNANCWIMTQNAGDGARFRITYFNGIPGSGGVYLGESPSTNVTGTSNWVQKTVSGTAPDGTTHIRLEFILFGGGIAWFDNVGLEEIAPTITVLSPNGAEAFVTKQTQNIMWNSTSVGNVTIDLLQNGNLLYNIATSVPNTGSYLWVIPDNQITLQNLRIRVADSMNPQISDTSDGEFAIFKPSLTLTYPVGSESLMAGTVHNLTWISVAVPDVKIELVQGSASSIIVSSIPNSGSYSWDIPISVIPGTDYKVRITSATDETIYNESGYFTITPAALTTINVVSPNGGESWQAGLNQTIVWSVTGNPGNVKIQLLKGVVSTLITPSTPNTGSYSWSIPQSHETGNYRIVITSVTAPNITDSSDNDFTIINPCPTPMSGFSHTSNNLSVQCVDVSTNLPTSWLWDFGDGVTSTLQNPIHDYDAAGTYIISLTATNLCGNGTPSSQSVQVSISTTQTVQSSNNNMMVVAAAGLVGLAALYFIVKDKGK